MVLGKTKCMPYQRFWLVNKTTLEKKTEKLMKMSSGAFGTVYKGARAGMNTDFDFGKSNFIFESEEEADAYLQTAVKDRISCYKAELKRLEKLIKKTKEKK